MLKLYFGIQDNETGNNQTDTKFLNKVVTEMNQLKYIFDFCEKMLKLYFENIG